MTGDLEALFEDLPPPEGRVEVLSLKRSGAVSIRIPTSTPRYFRGDTVLLRLQAKHLVEPIRLDLSVRTMRGLPDGGQRMDAEVCDWEAREVALLPRLRAAFNKRGEVRVAPPDGLTIRVRLRPPGAPGWAEGELVDVSRGGLGLRTSAFVGGFLREGMALEVNLRLPGMAESQWVSGNLRHLALGSTPSAGWALSGIALAGVEGTPFERAAIRFVMERQRELARKEAMTRRKASS